MPPKLNVEREGKLSNGAIYEQAKRKRWSSEKEGETDRETNRIPHVRARRLNCLLGI